MSGLERKTNSHMIELIDADEKSRAARRLLLTVPRPVSHEAAHQAIDLISESIARMETARAILIEAFPANPGEPS